MKYSDDNPDLNNISILVRAVFQSREIEESLIKYSIPYRIVGGIRFYERSEIKDAVSYLRLVYESQDDVAFERALTVPKSCLLYTSPSPRDLSTSRMPSSA